MGHCPPTLKELYWEPPKLVHPWWESCSFGPIMILTKPNRNRHSELRLFTDRSEAFENYVTLFFLTIWCWALLLSCVLQFYRSVPVRTKSFPPAASVLKNCLRFSLMQGHCLSKPSSCQVSLLECDQSLSANCFQIS